MEQTAVSPAPSFVLQTSPTTEQTTSATPTTTRLVPSVEDNTLLFLSKAESYDIHKRFVSIRQASMNI